MFVFESIVVSSKSLVYHDELLSSGKPLIRVLSRSRKPEASGIPPVFRFCGSSTEVELADFKFTSLNECI